MTVEQKKRLDNFLEDTSLNTSIAYQVKIEFDQLWNVQKLAVESLVNTWAKNALALNMKPINKFVNTFYNHYDGIIKSIKTGITNAVSEGLNSLMQLARTRARGYRNSHNFIAMIYYLGNPDLATH